MDQCAARLQIGIGELQGRDDLGEDASVVELAFQVMGERGFSRSVDSKDFYDRRHVLSWVASVEEPFSGNGEKTATVLYAEDELAGSFFGGAFFRSGGALFLDVLFFAGK